MERTFTVQAQDRALNEWLIPHPIRDPVMLNAFLCCISSTYKEWTSHSSYVGFSRHGRLRIRQNDGRILNSLHFKVAIKHLKRQLQVQNGGISISTVYGVFALLSNEVRQIPG